MRAGAAALALLLAAAPAFGEIEGFGFTRDVDVAAPGWVRVPLDLAALQHLAPGAADLHVFAPGGGEVPLRMEVEAVAGPAVEVATRDVECETDAPPGSTVCSVALPAAGLILRQLALEVEGEGRIGYRLDEPRNARWELLAEGVWQREDERTIHRLPGPPGPIAGTALRLELAGGAGSSPRLVSSSLELAVQTVLFQASAAGRYTLAYGGAARAGGRRAESRAGAEAVWTEAGPERVHAPPPLPSSTTAPGTVLANPGFMSGWRVLAPAAQPGDLVRLELPDEVYGVSRSDLGDLRLVLGERQIPFVRWSPPAPMLAAEERNLRPAERAEDARESEMEIHLMEPGLPLTALHLTAPPAPFRRAVGVRYLEPARTLRERAETVDPPPVARETWECRPAPPLPCRQEIPLPGPAPVLTSVRFHDGDNPPLAGLAATLWRRGDVLLFVWPETDDAAPVRLLAGATELRAPSYDLETLEDVLLGRPWQPAELDLEGSAAPEGGPWWSRWVMPATLVVAGVFLLGLLRRILTEA